MLAALMLVLASGWFIWFKPGYPLQVQIRGPAGSQTYDLFSHQTLSIKGEQGDSIIQIDQGKVRFVSSPCSTKQCVLAGWQDQLHDVVACLPNGVSITLLGRGTMFDSINF